MAAPDRPAADAWVDGPGVLAPVAKLQDGGAVWRLLWPFEELRQLGHRVAWEWDAPLLDVPRALAWPEFKPDAVVLPRVLRWDPPQLAALGRFVGALHRAGVAAVFDTDDDVYTPLRGQPAGGERTGAPTEAARAGYRAAVRLADGVTASTPAVAAAVRPHARPGAPVLVVPNALHSGWFRGVQARGAPLRLRPAAVTVGFAGGRQPWDFLETGLAKAWSRVAARYPHAGFVTVGPDSEPLLRHVPPPQRHPRGQVVFGDYPAAVCGIDIACCPLADNWIARCKSPQKVYEHALSGSAVVASPCVYGDPGVLPGFEANGGLLADGADAWEAAISRLVEHAQERRERAEQLARWVEREHTVEGQAGLWVEAWRTIVGPPAVTKAPAGPWDAYLSQRAARKAAAKRARKARRRV
jgi:hypothetical protein